jgi:hypothetical protein
MSPRLDHLQQRRRKFWLQLPGWRAVNGGVPVIDQCGSVVAGRERGKHAVSGRRAVLDGGVGVLLLLTLSLAWAQIPAMPKSPVTINVIDVAGDLALTRGAIEAYQAKHPELVSRVTFSKAPAPELAGSS